MKKAFWKMVNYCYISGLIGFLAGFITSGYGVAEGVSTAVIPILICITQSEWLERVEFGYYRD